MVSIAEDGAGFKMTVNLITRRVAHLHYDVFQVPDDPFDEFARAKVMFLSDANGDISSLSLPLETNVKDILFTRLPEPQLTDRKFVEAFTGQWEIPESHISLTLSLRADHTFLD